MEDIETLITDVAGMTGRHGDKERMRKSIKTVLAGLHASSYFTPNLRSGVIRFNQPYRVAKIAMTPAQFGHLRKLKQVRHCADSATGLPLGKRIPLANFDQIVYQATDPGDHYLLENGYLNIRVAHPV